jgi:hypothetical protein
MCEFISDYEYSKLFKRKMDKLAEQEEQQPELEKVEEQPLVTSNKRSQLKILSRSLFLLLTHFILDILSTFV